MKVIVQNDKRNILEDQTSIDGNVFDNNIAVPEQINSEMVVKPGSLVSQVTGEQADNNGVIQGRYGVLTLHSDGSYNYTLNKDMNYLGAGVDRSEEFKFTTEYHGRSKAYVTAYNVAYNTAIIAAGTQVNANTPGGANSSSAEAVANAAGIAAGIAADALVGNNPVGGDQAETEKIIIDIHGQNDEAVIKNVCVSVYEGLTGDTKVLGALGTGVATTGDNVDFEGQLVIEDQDATKAGLQADGDVGDVHKLVIDESTITVASDDLSAAQLAAIKATINAKLKDDSLTVTEDGTAPADFGKYYVDGNFDALSVGDEACVKFEYYVEDTSTAGEVSKGEHRTVSVKVLGTNDAVTINDDEITNYHQLIDGDLYKSILKNDEHATTLAATAATAGTVGDHDHPDTPATPATIAVKADVNDTLTVTDTIRTDLEFVNDGGHICVDNAAQSIRYQPGNGDVIAKDHFEFTYAASDGYTDPIGTAAVTVAMRNADDNANHDNSEGAVDFYQFGNAADNSLVGSDKSDMLSGGNGNDSLNGGAGADILYGGAGQDCIVSGAGNDIVIGGKGNDSMCDVLGDDKYVFAKGDGCDTITDRNEEFITDSHGDMISNPGYADNKDVVHFDDSVKTEDIAVFMNGTTLEIKYSQDCDVVRVVNQDDAHFGIEEIQAHNGASSMTKAELDTLLTTISTYDIDSATAGVQTAQSVNDVQGNAHLMGLINAAFA